MAKFSIICFAISLLLSGCQQLEPHGIRFVVEATGKCKCVQPDDEGDLKEKWEEIHQCADIQLTSSNGSQSYKRVELPWESFYYGYIGTSKDDTKYSLSAKNTKGLPSLTVKILRDGEVKRSQTVTGKDETAKVELEF